MKIFVFGSNREGRHGKGAALCAKLQHGAVYGQARGRQGRSYAIVTKELRKDHPPVTLNEVWSEVNHFIVHALLYPNDTFEVTRIGCGLAGFKEEDIKAMFKNAPPNCNLPEGWRE
jgi:hypothetical protein